MYGPGTNLAHGGSLIFHSECQMRYITGCLELLLAGGHRCDGARARSRRRLARAHPGRAAQAGVVAAVGQALVVQEPRTAKIHVLSPWRLVDYWTWTREPDPDDFVFR